MKKIISCLIALFVLCGCSNIQATSTAIELPDAKETLENANKVMSNVNSMSIASYVEMQLSINGQTEEAYVQMDMDMELVDKNINMKLDMVSYSNDEEVSTSLVYIDGVYYLEADGEKYCMSIDLDELGVQADYEEMNITYSNMKTMVYDDYIKVTIQPTKAEIQKTLEDFGNLSESSGINEDFIKELSSIKCDDYNIYISNDGYVFKQTFGFYASYQSNEMYVKFVISTDNINNVKVKLDNKDEYFNLDPYL